LKYLIVFKRWWQESRLATTLQYFAKNISRHFLTFVFAVSVLVSFNFNLLGFVSVPTQDTLYYNQTPSSEIVILGIDENSLKTFGAWPWDRSIFADIIDRVNQASAKTLAFDVLFNDFRESDDLFVDSLNKTKTNIVLASKIDSDNSKIIFPQSIINQISTDKTSFGVANIDLDQDKKVREVRLQYEFEEKCFSILGLQGLASWYSDQGGCYGNNKRLGLSLLPEKLMINFYGPKQTIKTYSLTDFMDKPFNLKLLEHKLVFLGSTIQDLKVGINDTVTTPLGQIPGVEVHATIANNILQNSFLKRVSNLWHNLLILFLFILSFSLAWRLESIKSALRLLVLVLSYVLIVSILARWYILVELFYTLLAIFMAWILGVGHRFSLQKQENVNLKNIFTRYTDSRLLKKVLANADNISLSGEKREMSIFFADIRGFTTITEELDPEELISLLNRYFELATNEIFQLEGTIDKFIGDAIMAHWNSIVDDPLHAFHASQAAVNFSNQLDLFNTDSNFKNKLNVGIGIASGEAIVGNIGSKQRFEYTALGDKVNLASRLEGLTKQYGAKILISEETFQHLKLLGKINLFLIRPIDQVVVKGKTKPVQIYEIFPKNNAQNQNLTQLYQKAFELYLSGDFEKAIQDFNFLSQSFNDKASSILSSRCETLKNQDISNWSRAWVWTEK
jgi:adenylate cyclase